MADAGAVRPVSIPALGGLMWLLFCSLQILIRNSVFTNASFSCALIIDFDQKSQKESTQSQAHRHPQCAVLMEPLQAGRRSGARGVPPSRSRSVGHRARVIPKPISEFL